MVPAAGGKPLRLVISTHEDQDREDREYWRNRSPEERLEALELLRIESGKLLYDVSTDNLEPLRSALMEFGFQSTQFATATFANPGAVVTFGIGRAEVLRNRRATGRLRDAADAEELETDG